MRMLHSKKGLTPLIATILLIAFAVALGAVVMNLGKNPPSFMNAGFSIMEMGGARQICFFDRGENSALEFTLQNGDVMEIVNLQISLVGTNDIVNKDRLLTETIQKGEAKRVMVMYDSGQVGNLRMVAITPNIIRNGEKTLGTSLKVEGIQPCE